MTSICPDIHGCCSLIVVIENLIARLVNTNPPDFRLIITSELVHDKAQIVDRPQRSKTDLLQTVFTFMLLKLWARALAD